MLPGLGLSFWIVASMRLASCLLGKERDLVIGDGAARDTDQRMAPLNGDSLNEAKKGPELADDIIQETLYPTSPPPLASQLIET